MSGTRSVADRAAAPSAARAGACARPSVPGRNLRHRLPHFQGKHPFLQYPRVMGHELAVEVVDAPEGSDASVGAICVVNPYLSCGCCIACRAGKPNCCVNISVLGVHQDGGMTGLLSVPPGNLVRADGLTVDECATVEFLAIGAHAVRRAARDGPRPRAGRREPAQSVSALLCSLAYQVLALPCSTAIRSARRLPSRLPA